MSGREIALFLSRPVLSFDHYLSIYPPAEMLVEG